MMEELYGNRTDAAMRQRFEEALLPHLDAAYNLARWLMHNPQDAEDCVQEAYLRAYKAFPRFRQGDGRAWLTAIVRNVCYTAIKRLRGRKEMEPFDEELHFPTPNPSTETPREADAEAVQLMLMNLAPEFRELIVLHDLEGFSYKEIAAIAGIPIGTVMSRLSRGREKLRADLAAFSKDSNI